MTQSDGGHSVTAVDSPDRRDGRVYVMSDDLMLAVDVALATGRPLLLRGDPGSGKSSLAAHLARHWQWRYYEHVVTSQTQAQDLLWRYDHVRRLADAQVLRAGERLDDFAYIEPGPLWWAFAPSSARRRGRPDGSVAEPAVEPPSSMTFDSGHADENAVVLIDEIDKADPDLPNNLLVPLGSSEFVVGVINTVVHKDPPTAVATPRRSRHLIIITTNEERELPHAFLRRCVVFWLTHPDADRLAAIARAHLQAYDGGVGEADESLIRAIATELLSAREESARRAMRAPSTAEFLDAIRACRSLGVTVDSPLWTQIRSLTMVKPQHVDGPR